VPNQSLHKGRRRGINIDPGAVRRARLEAGLSLAQIVAGGGVSRQQVHLVEKGRARPSAQTLQLIAARTGKPISYFVAGAHAGTAAGESRGTDALSELERLTAQRDFASAVSTARQLLMPPSLAPELEAHARFHLGQALCRTLDAPAALPELRAARASFELRGDMWMAVECLDWEASAMFLTEEPGAVEAAERALRQCTELDPVPPATHARILGHLAWMHVDRHEWARALHYAQAAVEAAGAVHDLLQLAKSHSDMGLAYQQLGNPGRARECMQHALHLYTLQSDLAAACRCESNLGELLIREGDLDRAEAHLRHALAGVDALGVDRRSRGYMLNNLAEVALRRGDRAAAREFLESAIAVAAATGESVVRAGSELLLGRCAELDGDLQGSDRHHADAISLLRELRMPDRLRDAHMEYARQLKARGELERAATHWEEAAEIGREISTGVSAIGLEWWRVTAG